jgi:hypothetical protein
MPSARARTTASVRLRACSARRMAAMWIFTVPSVSPSSRAISLLGSPRSSSCSTSCWRAVSAGAPVVDAAAVGVSSRRTGT